jgi:glycosidase
MNPSPRFSPFALLLVLILLLVAACGRAVPATMPAAEPTTVPTTTPTALPTTLPTPEPEAEEGEGEEESADWWHDAVFYQIFVRSFFDSSGDGTGDFNGLTARLDYLSDLGVTALWLLPVNEATSYHGYDVVDYQRVESDYGSKESLKQFIAAAQARGIRIIVDLVINHTGVEHPWFQQSRNPDSPFRDWYIWSDRPGRTGWHRDDSGYYYGIFWGGMPDLNFENPAVTRAVHGFTRYWLEEMNVDGFRLDAIKFLIESGDVLENTPETITWFQEYNRFVKGIKPDALLVGEVWSSTSDSAIYVQQDAVDLTFAFNLAEALISTSRGTGNNYSGALDLVLKSYPDNRFAGFITNHDQNRVISQLYNDINRGKPAATLLLTSPGVPFIYYGEEIGMTGMKPDERLRTPMQWSADSHAGFSPVEPWQPLANGWETVNVAAQADDPDSLLTHYRTLIALRHDWSALRAGGWLPVQTGDRKLYGHLRTADDHAVLVLVNTTRDPISDYAVTVTGAGLAAGWQAARLMGGDPAPATIVNGGLEGYRPIPELPPLSTTIIAFVLP